MLKLCYAGVSYPSARRIGNASDNEIVLTRSAHGDVNWGRRHAETALNPDTSTVANKRRMRELFQRHDVPAPRLYLTPEDATSAIWHDQVLVGRPDYHTRGKGFWLCSTYEDVERAISGTVHKASATHFMEYIDAPHEYRVHVFNGKSLRISEKKFVTPQGSHRVYTTIKPTGNVKHVRKAAKAALGAVGLDFGAVDILATDDDCWVLEVNAAPGLGGSMPEVYAEAFLRWYEEE